jgi:phosphate acyltransferase
VVKSHGASDAVGVASAISLAHRLTREKFLQRLASRVAAGQSEPPMNSQAGAGE